jgi:hypothetical protein
LIEGAAVFVFRLVDPVRDDNSDAKMTTVQL